METPPPTSPAPKQRKISYSSFDEDIFIEFMMEKKKNRIMCCGESCLLRIKESEIKVHAMLISFYSSIRPSDLRNRIYRSFVMSCYMLHVGCNGNHGQYRIPAVGHKLCKGTWLQFMNISPSCYAGWRAYTLQSRNVLPLNHGLTTDSTNAGKPAAKAAARQYIKDVAESDGHPLPVCVRASDKMRFEEGNSLESIVFLPPKYSKRSLHASYNAMQTDPTMCLSLSTFRYILDKDLPYVRVSLRTRGLCDICFVYRDLVKKVSDANVSQKGKEWGDHIALAGKTRDIYRASLFMARAEAKFLLPVRMKSATISYDYARQLSIPILSEQTMNEWFPEKKGYDVNLFGIVDEGFGDNGLQYNYIYGEGTKHGSIQVASMLNHFFTKTCAPIGLSKTLYLHSDSCTGQNKNNIVLGYFMLRVALGFHEEIIWQFMAVGHTKFRPDEGFGKIRTRVDGRDIILSMKEMKAAIEASASTNRYVIFPVEDVQDWKEVSNIFNSLYGIRKNFAYKIHVRSCTVSGNRSITVDVHHEPGGEQPDQSVNLVKQGVQFPGLTSFRRVEARPLTLARRTGLLKDVYSVLIRNRVDMTDEARAWWTEDVIKNTDGSENN